MISAYACAKTHPSLIQDGLNEQQAMMYMKLRQAGCRQVTARKFCSRNFCRIDQTAKLVGPLECKIITPIIHPKIGVHGWEPNLTVKYDLGDKFRLAKELEMRESDIEVAIQKKFEKMKLNYEGTLKDKIRELQYYIRESQGKDLVPCQKNNQDLLQSLKTVSQGFRNQNASQDRYMKHKGMKFHYIVDEVINECQENLGITIKEQYTPMDYKDDEILTQQPVVHDKRVLMHQKSWTPSAITTTHHRKSQFSNIKQTPQEINYDTEAYNQNSSQNNHIQRQSFSMKQIKNPGSAFRRNSLEKSEKPMSIKQKLNHIIQPFQPIYNINPSKITIQFNDKPKREMQGKNKFKSYQRTLNQISAESELIINLLNQNGISDSLDFKYITNAPKNQIKPSAQFINILNEQSDKLKMAKEFNQTQYLFNHQEFKQSKNTQLVYTNYSKNGQSINDISLIKSPNNQFSRGISDQRDSKQQSIDSLASEIEQKQLQSDIEQKPRYSRTYSKQESFIKSDNQSINSSSQLSIHKVDFDVQLKKLVSDSVDKMNQKGVLVQVNDTQLKIQQIALINRMYNYENRHTSKRYLSTTSPKIQRILFTPKLVRQPKFG